MCRELAHETGVRCQCGGECRCQEGPGEERELDLEQIGPRDTRWRVASTSPAPYRWICRVFSDYVDEATGATVGYGVGTGFLISSQHVLTAGHVVRDTDGGRTLVARNTVVEPGRNGPGGRPFGRFTLCRADAPAWSASMDQVDDWAVLTLAKRVPTPFGWFGRTIYPLVAADRDVLRKTRLRVIGYPGDRCGPHPKTSTAGRRLCGTPALERANWGSSLFFASEDGLHPSSPVSPMWHLIDTKAGNSGGPVMARIANRSVVVGIHTGTQQNAAGVFFANRFVPFTTALLGRIAALTRRAC